MAGFGKKKAITEYLYSKGAVVIMGIIVVFLASAVHERYVVERHMSERKTETELQKQTLIQRKETLTNRVEYLQADRGVEEEIRTHFDVAKEGEKVIILVGDTTEKDTVATTTKAVRPWYKFW